jgi:hypothetical protein
MLLVYNIFTLLLVATIAEAHYAKVLKKAQKIIILDVLLLTFNTNLVLPQQYLVSEL